MTELAVLVSSCDRYQDLWRPFFTLFFRYWPACPYPVYLASNYRLYTDPRVNMITVGEDADWSSSFGRALKQIPHPYVIVSMEDFFLSAPVDTARIQALAKYLDERKGGCLRLFPSPGPDVPCTDDPQVGEILKGSDYRASLQTAVWDRRVLLGLLREGETPWEFEIKGSRRTDDLEVPFFSVIRGADSPIPHCPIPYFCTAVEKGRWLRDAVAFCREQAVEIDLSVRPCESWWSYLGRTRLRRLRERIGAWRRRILVRA